MEIVEKPLDQTFSCTLEKLLRDALIDPHQFLDQSPVCLHKVEEDGLSTLATLGNISLVIGKAKSGKTFLMSALMAAIVKNNEEVNSLKACMPRGKEVCLYFDTEQSSYHAQKTVRRVLAMAAIKDSANFLPYGLRSHSAEKRLEMIKHAIYNTENIGFVVIDGIRDLISTINDEKESIALSAALMKWSQEKNIHIMCVLHKNKTDDNARGHVGTEMINKAEIVVSVGKTNSKQSPFKVECTMSRDKGFKHFNFIINEQGLIIIDNTTLSERNQKKKKFSPNDWDLNKHMELLNSIFSNNNRYTYSKNLAAIEEAFLKQDINLSQAAQRDLHKYYLSNNLIQQNGKSKSVSSYYTLPIVAM